MTRRHGLFFAGILLVGFLAGWFGSETVDPSRRAEAAAEPAKAAPAAPPDDGKLRIIAFGAHPDDCEIKVGGTGAKWAALGHYVKLVSVTNGDIGHYQSAGGPLARRRLAEVQRADKILGVATQVLDIHDGELEPTLEHRRTITRLIREWKADIVLAHRPNDYHPDHRYTGILVQDASFMVTVPFFCPDVPYLTKNPVFLYYSDRFERPNNFRADIIVAVDDVEEKKLAALDVMESQFFERGTMGSTELTAKARQPGAAAQGSPARLPGTRCLRGGEVPRSADRVLWQGQGRQGATCGGVRDHRVRQPAEREGNQEAVSVLRVILLIQQRLASRASVGPE